jgi:glutamine cyclotransferase
MSDGTATLYFRDPQTFQEIGHVEVYDRNGPVAKLNELEYVNGEVYANIWETDLIARISPQTGQVLGWIDLTGLLSSEERQPPVDVLNGIAYDPANDRLFVTGKRWPKLFEIDLVAP